MWPDEELPELRPAFQELGRLIIKIGLLLARQCDRYSQSSNPAMEAGKLERVLRDSPIPKGRLLHYYPPATADAGSSWCAEHTDHGSLTGAGWSLFWMLIRSRFACWCLQKTNKQYLYRLKCFSEIL